MTLQEEAKIISDYLQTTCQGNPQEIQQRIADTMVYVARTGEMLATAKQQLRRRKSEEIQNTIKPSPRKTASRPRCRTPCSTASPKKKPSSSTPSTGSTPPPPTSSTRCARCSPTNARG